VAWECNEKVVGSDLLGVIIFPLLLTQLTTDGCVGFLVLKIFKKTGPQNMVHMKL